MCVNVVVGKGGGGGGRGEKAQVSLQWASISTSGKIGNVIETHKK